MPLRPLPPRSAAAAFVLLSALTHGGCFAERSFPMVEGRLARLTAAPADARSWAAAAHAAAAGRLPADDRRALLTADLAAPGGGVVNVWRRLGVDPDRVDSLWGNLRGLEQTAQVASPPPRIENGHITRGPWPGFEDVDVPGGADGVRLFGRLGTPEPGRAIPGSYVIITHGLFGSMDGLDVENHVQALRRAGHHVLAVEMRGHGETQCRHPEYVIGFGVHEAGDLVAAAWWLKETHGAGRVGLVSFSLTGYEALLTAWVDGRRPAGGADGEPLLAGLPAWREAPAFDGGMFVVSPPVGLVGLADRFERPVGPLEAPCKHTFQRHVAERLAAYGEPPAATMWALARSEFSRGGFAAAYGSFERAYAALMRFIDWSRDDWAVGAARADNFRVPVLVLAAANDPLGTGQSVAELFGRTTNPNVGVILLKEGGHMGFTALSADYYYSLMVNFFDPRTGPRRQ